MEKISVRKAKDAISGLIDLIDFCRKIAEVPLKQLVEIGSYVGDSTKVFAMNFDKVIAIDPWENGYDESDASSYQYEMSIIESQFDSMRKDFDNIKKMKMTGVAAAQLFEDESLDIVYIDAVHQYKNVKQDIMNWYPKVKIGGIIAGHDYQSSFQGVIDAVDESFGSSPMFIGKDTSWAYLKRKKNL